MKTAESEGPRGFDAGKIDGRNRHGLVDTYGRALTIQLLPASVHDGEGPVPLLQTSRGSYPFIERVFADATYVAEGVASATRMVVEIVRKLPYQVGFAVLPRRWVVERFFA